MSQIRLSPRVGEDLAAIHRYVAADNPTAANQLIAGFFKLFELLADNPLIGESRKDLRPNLRCITRQSYVTFFYPMSDGVEIAAVIHGARDIESAL